MSNMKFLKHAYIILYMYLPVMSCPTQDAKQKNIVITKEPCIESQRKNLITIIMNGTASELDKILKDGVNPNFYFEISPDAWVTPLQAALLKQDPTMINILLKSPAVDLTYRLPYEYSNLEFTVLHLSISLARLLLQQGIAPAIGAHIMHFLYRDEAPNGKSREMIKLLETYKHYWRAMQEFVKVQYCPESPAYNTSQFILKKIFFEHILTTS